MSLQMKRGIAADHLRRRINPAIPATYFHRPLYFFHLRYHFETWIKLASVYPRYAAIKGRVETQKA
jgi:hypothetical protein